jgi:hypothetical protein
VAQFGSAPVLGTGASSNRGRVARVKVCGKCCTEKDFAEFSKKTSGKDGYQSYCKTCVNIYYKNYYTNNPEEKKRIIRNVKKKRVKMRLEIQKAKSVPCADCQVSYPYYVMDFDHVRGTKKFDVGTATSTKTMKALSEEIAKCEVVCANCHRMRTHKDRLLN